jgi:hypothetical protein
MGIEVNQHEQWPKNYLVDQLKEHLATFEVSITPTDDKKVYDRRKYYQHAYESLLFGALKPAPPFIIYLSDLTPKMIRELYDLDSESRKYVLKQAVGKIFEDINSDLYHNSISKVLKVRLKDG